VADVSQTEETDEPIQLDRRRTMRDRILQRAAILAPNGTHPCLVLDLSPLGARLEMMGPMPAGDRFTLRFSDGRSFGCELRWAVGVRLGVEILEAAVPVGDRRERAAVLVQRLEGSGLQDLFRRLRDEHFLNSRSVGAAAWAAETAIKALEDAIREECGEEPPGAPAPASPPPQAEG